MKICRSCKKEKILSLFVKNKAFKSGIDTICLDCSREKVKAWRKSGKRDSRKERNAALLRNKEKVLQNERERVRRYYDKYLRSSRVLKTKEELRATKYKNDAKRRARKKYVNWQKELTDLVSFEAKHLCQLRENITKFKWHVDHIIPLCGKTVSGLHVWNNLQVVPAIINLRKNNGFTI